jgi:hypothetical protein
MDRKKSLQRNIAVVQMLLLFSVATVIVICAWVIHFLVTSTSLSHPQISRTVPKGLSNLRLLHLRHTQITDLGLANLRELKDLEFLQLEDTAVTDAGLDHL